MRVRLRGERNAPMTESHRDHVRAPTAPPELAGTLGQILSWVRYRTLWAGGLTILVSTLVWGFAANSSNHQNVSRA